MCQGSHSGWIFHRWILSIGGEHLDCLSLDARYRIDRDDRSSPDPHYEGYGVSADGRIVVGSAGIEYTRQSCFWDARGALHLLGNFPGIPHMDAAIGASAHGRFIIGQSGGTPFVWDAIHG